MSLLRSVSLRLRPWRQDSFLLGVSGGMDSMALLQVFNQLRQKFNYSFGVAHFHHGESLDLKQSQFRDQAEALVTKVCRTQELSLHAERSRVAGGSEKACREQRYEFFNRTARAHGYNHIVLAHHWEDLLETRLLRLIRGTGAQGLQAMVEVNPPLLRPFLTHHRAELLSVLQDAHGEWIEDPSNSQERAQRNWLRHQWLPALEARQPGAIQALGRSLELLTQSLEERDMTWSQCLVQGEVLLNEFWCLDQSQKTTALANYMKSQGLKNYGLSHIYEILKRLDTQQKTLTFSLLGRCWKVDAGRMSVSPPA